MTAKQTPKQRLQTEAGGMGLSIDGTIPELRRRIDAALEAAADTAEAVHGSQLELFPEPEKRSPVHPVNAALLGGAIGAVLHFIG